MIFELAQTLVGWVVVASLSGVAFGHWGVLSGTWDAWPVLKLIAFFVVIVHLTGAAMTISFHRVHTHQSVVLNKFIDRLLQAWLWMSTSMTKRDWVSIHAYHHAHSDTQEDPHSPVVKGLWRIVFGGVLDYVRAKTNPGVLKIRHRIPEDWFESFMERNSFLGVIVTGAALLVLFGPWMGSIMMLMMFLSMPIFAVGGVNGFAHSLGYRNYKTDDNSRNLGFFYPLNWMAGGELDHNNHHAKPSAASFRHRWWEFDVGYAYIVVLSWFRLAQIKYASRLKDLGRPNSVV